MAYGDAFDPTQPPGGQVIALGDDAIRALARAIMQRLDTLMNFSTSTDPVTDPVKIKVGGISASNMIGANVVDTANINNNAVTTAKILDAAVTMLKIDPAAHVRGFIRADGVLTKDPFNTGTSFPVTVAAPGAVIGMMVMFNWTTAPGAVVPSAYGRVDTTDEIKVVFENQSGATLHISGMGFKVMAT